MTTGDTMGGNQSLVENIYKNILSDIQGGALKPGSKISENSVCAELKVSRTPVREALIRLAAEGKVIKIPNRGFFVCDTANNHRREVYQVIGALDALAAGLACKRMGTEELLRMQELIAKMDIAIQFHNAGDYTQFQEEFHYVYISRCGNSVLIGMIKSMFTSPVPKTYVGKDDRLFSLCSICNQEHREILELMRAGKLKELSDVINKHWTVFRMEDEEDMEDISHDSV
jgi:DNA-binding GntR family transcriptional regulator